jgi:DNA-binding CsgD family transcriptional regulator
MPHAPLFAAVPPTHLTLVAERTPRLRVTGYEHLSLLVPGSTITISTQVVVPLQQLHMSVGVLHAASEDDVIFAVVEVEYPQRNTVPIGQLERLTERERQDARLVAQGFSSKEIAQQLSIAVHTVRRHSERIFKKLGVHSRAKLMADYR